MSSLDVKFTQISSGETVPLRHSVLWPNHPVSHVLLPEDEQSFHFGAFVPQREKSPVAVISLFLEALPTPESECTDAKGIRAAHFRKFACDRAYQGQGIGTALLKYCFEYVRSSLGCSVVWCDARVVTADWYERRGMQKFGDRFFKGPVEYIRMKADLGCTT